MYELRIAIKARNEIKKLRKFYQLALLEAFQDLRMDPYLGKPLTRDLEGRFAYRIGVFRIIYKISIKDKVVEILSAGHRSGVYY